MASGGLRPFHFQTDTQLERATKFHFQPVTRHLLYCVLPHIIVFV
jgi:hypothetical protein